MAELGLKPTILYWLSNSGILSSLIWTPTTDLAILLVSVFRCLLPSFPIAILSASKGPILKHKYDRAAPTLVRAAQACLLIPLHLLLLFLYWCLDHSYTFGVGSTCHASSLLLLFLLFETPLFSPPLFSSCVCRWTCYSSFQAHSSK